MATDSDAVSYIYYPIIEYKVGEDTVRVKFDSGSNVPAYDINAKITVLYNPSNTKEFIIKGEKSADIVSIAFMVMGVALVGYGVKVAIKGE